jgi:hypothetical protein
MQIPSTPWSIMQSSTRRAPRQVEAARVASKGVGAIG